MSRRLQLLLLVIIAGLIVSVAVWMIKTPNHAAESSALKPVVNDTLFNQTTELLEAYYGLKSAFVDSDTAAVNRAAAVFLARLDTLDLHNLRADSSVTQTAMDLKKSISGHTQQALAFDDLGKKRRSFQLISDDLFDFLRLVKYSGEKVYQQYCPMAFDNEGAAWLSNSTEVVNPYFGKKMLHCGELRDSLRPQ